MTGREKQDCGGPPIFVVDFGSDAEVMEQGADDYIRMPIDPLGFPVRVRVELRRA